ncbi:hypothetical protein [Saccharophagus degradans]|uniref:Uncharacterized protein n=1 Tax=Saccharophagus degradans TaxID=86304 RepID=A0AAW7X703_9GAMM|nr:hypothetical protein [Saccharophagus degradans]MDO6423344.1 hypothetical protein [Saccharophagus degradans]MDO6606749.1 hypothetical protein [Saccharophagus degradans]
MSKFTAHISASVTQSLYTGWQPRVSEDLDSKAITLQSYNWRVIANSSCKLVLAALPLNFYANEQNMLNV